MPSRRISNWHYVYVLLSERYKDFYVGYTRDIGQRLKQHNARDNFSTKGKSPYRLIYAETCLDINDAMRREKYLKTTQGRRFLKLRLRKFLKEDNSKFLYWV